MSEEKVLFVCCKTNSAEIVINFIKKNFKNATILIWNYGEDEPSEILQWKGDWIISYIGDYIFSKTLLNNAKKGALNFHPSVPKYRGIGSHHYAIYNEDKIFGATCHHINETIDKGTIIKVDRFSIAPNETASSLRSRVEAYCLTQFYDIVIEHVITGKELPSSTETWGEELFTYKKLESFKKIIKRKEIDHKCLK